MRNCFKFGPVVQVMSFNGISYLQLGWPFCSAERNHLCNFGRVSSCNFNLLCCINLLFSFCYIVCTRRALVHHLISTWHVVFTRCHHVISTCYVL